MSVFSRWVKPPQSTQPPQPPPKLVRFGDLEPGAYFRFPNQGDIIVKRKESNGEPHCRGCYITGSWPGMHCRMRDYHMVEELDLEFVLED
jgi:hypothetical protein